MSDERKLLVLLLQELDAPVGSGEKAPASVWVQPDYGEADDGPRTWEDPQAVQLTDPISFDSAWGIGTAVVKLLESLGYDVLLAEEAFA